jgi:hypothetical protein
VFLRDILKKATIYIFAITAAGSARTAEVMTNATKGEKSNGHADFLYC